MDLTNLPVIELDRLEDHLGGFYFETYPCMSPENAPQFENQLEFLHPFLELSQNYPFYTSGYGGGIMSVLVWIRKDAVISVGQYNIFKNDPNTWFTKNLVKLDTNYVQDPN